jgi:hypothetical protein
MAWQQDGTGCVQIQGLLWLVSNFSITYPVD